jgi:hypothetical protein
MDEIWVFNGGGQFPAAVFSSREKAEVWIAERVLSGVLTKYPVDVPVYDWPSLTVRSSPIGRTNHNQNSLDDSVPRVRSTTTTLKAHWNSS